MSQQSSVLPGLLTAGDHNRRTMLQSALTYAEVGWPVIPLHTPGTDGHCSCRRDCDRNNGKHPRNLNGLTGATGSVEQIRMWWSQWPAANIGVLTGAETGIVVVDLDDDKDGWATLDELQERFGHLPETPAVVTGSGGIHFYFQHPGVHVPPSAGKLGPGLDVRGDGSYVVAPPSLHRSGRRYEWEAEWSPARLPLAELPAWLAEPLTNRVSTSVSGSSPETHAIVDGQRNTTLTSMAGTMRRRSFTEDAIRAALLVENEARCRPPLPDSEITRIARSVARYDPTDPLAPRRRRQSVEFVGGRAVVR